MAAIPGPVPADVVRVWGMNDAENHGLLETVTRRINPFGFGMALLLFLFVPSVAMSWEFPGTESIARLRPFLDVSSTGVNMAVHQSRIHVDVAVRVFAIATFIVIAAGVATTAARTPQMRALAAAVAAALSGGLLIATVLLGVGWLEDSQREFLSILSSEFSKTERAGLLGLVDHAGGLRPGFWLALTVLVLVGAINMVVLLREISARRGLGVVEGRSGRSGVACGARNSGQSR